jgi:nitric oxide reductase NorD protein
VPSSEPFDQAALGARLDAIFSFDVSSGRNYDELIEPLLGAGRLEQEFALHWATVAARTHLEIAYLVVLLVPQALRRLSARQAEAWVVAALDGFDRVGLRAAVMRLRDIEGFARGVSPAAVSLDAITPRLLRFLQGLSGRSLRVEADGAVWTDTETVFLPPLIELASHEASAERYLALAALLWAQGRWGSYAIDIDAALAGFDRPDHALGWLALLEARRLSARLVQELPGLRDELARLLDGLPPQLDAARDALAAPGAGIAECIAWLRDHAQLAVSPAPTLGHLPVLRPAAARRCAPRASANRARCCACRSPNCWNPCAKRRTARRRIWTSTRMRNAWNST